jgi:hypothetical protein
MPYLDLNSGTASLTGVGTFGALVPVVGDTFTVRTLGSQQAATLLGFGRKGATAGMCRVRSPFLHDFVNGIRARVLAADPSSVMDENSNQPLRGQDGLVFESTGGAAAEQESGWILNYYDTLSGEPSQYISDAELDSRAAEYVTTEVPTVGGAGAIWGSALLSSGTGILKANQTYAVVGYDLDVPCTAIGISGPDTGNFRAGGPGITTRQFSRDFFRRLSRLAHLPTIPCINAQNASGTNIWVVDSAGATTVNVNLILARLK